MRILEWASPQEAEAAQESPLQLDVVYTGGTDTRAALGAAAQLRNGVDARVRVIVLRPVPYPLPLDDPPVSMRFDRERMMAFVNENYADASVVLCYCRDEVDALLYLLQSSSKRLASSSMVVIGGKNRRWLPTKAQRIARKLEDAGHRVVFVDPEGKHA